MIIRLRKLDSKDPWKSEVTREKESEVFENAIKVIDDFFLEKKKQFLVFPSRLLLCSPHSLRPVYRDGTTTGREFISFLQLIQPHMISFLFFYTSERLVRSVVPGVNAKF